MEISPISENAFKNTVTQKQVLNKIKKMNAPVAPVGNDAIESVPDVEHFEPTVPKKIQRMQMVADTIQQVAPQLITE